MRYEDLKNLSDEYRLNVLVSYIYKPSEVTEDTFNHWVKHNAEFTAEDYSNENQTDHEQI